MEYYFTAEGDFYFSLTDYAADELPDMVLTTLEMTYPAYSLDDDVSELMYADGSLAYEVEITTSTGDDIELVIDSDGNILCEED